MDTPVKKRWIIALRVAIGIALFLLVMTRVDLREMAELLRHAHLPSLVGVVLLFFCLFLVKTLRWQYLLGLNALALPFPRALYMYIVSCLMGFVTPGRLGEMIRIVPPAKENGRYVDSTACMAVDKAYDIALFAILLCAGALAATLPTTLRWIGGGLGVLIILGLAIGFVLVRGWVKRGAPIPDKIIGALPKTWQTFMAEKPANFFRVSYVTALRSWLAGPVLTILFWIVHVACHYMMLRSLGKSMDLGYFIMCLILVSLVEFVPITISGLGTREVLFVYLFEPAGLSSEEAFAFASLNLFLMYIVTSVFVLCLWPISRRTEESAHDR
jgi:uncharacterized protein (TIRG00374 family)